MVSSVVGSNRWLANYRKHPLGVFVSISDEVFALVNYENNLRRWQDMFSRGDLKTSDVKAEWTNSGDSVKDGKSKRFRGWAKAGVDQFDANYKAVSKDRRDNEDFDGDALEAYQNAYGKHTESGKVDNTVDEDYGEPHHDLPWGTNASTTPNERRSQQIQESSGDESSDSDDSE